MPHLDRPEPATFCWAELVTSDAAGAKQFYTRLFGWKHRDDPIGPDAFYTMLLQEGDAIGALYQRSPQEQEQGVPPHWGLYVGIENVDRAAERVWDLGGKVLGGPFDVMDAGRMTILQDPSGAILSLWQGRQHPGFQRHGEPGTLVWGELMTHDLEAAGRFYERLLGWDRHVEPMPGFEYTVFRLANRPVAGMMAIDPAWGEVPPNWMAYFQVADCDAAVARAREAGGKVHKETTPIPGTGRFAIIQDPQGAVFGILEPAPMG